MLPERLMSFRNLLIFGLAAILVLLLGAGCRVSSTPTGEPVETPCESCQEPESPLVAALNSPLAGPAANPTQPVPSPAPTRTARSSAQPPAGTPTLVVKTATAVPLDDTAFNLTIFHSNDTWGYLDPCGWKVKTGGVARRATVIKRERAKGMSLLVLDAGNALAYDREPAKKSQGQSSVTVMNMMGYDVVGLGAKDLSLGVKALQQRMAEADFAFVAANVFISETGALLAEPYVLREVGGYQVAIVGITSAAKRPGLRVEDPLETAKRIVPEAAAQADVVILLTQVKSDKAHEIANQVPGIDLVVGGGNQAQVGLWYSKTQVPVVCADRSSPGHAGRNVGLANLAFDAAGELLDIQWQSIPLTAKNAPNDPDVLEWSNLQPRR